MDESQPNTERSPPEALTLDIDALERAAAAGAEQAQAFRPASDLPPPPTNLFREKTATGGYRSLSQPPPAVRPVPPPDTGARTVSRPPPPVRENKPGKPQQGTPPRPVERMDNDARPIPPKPGPPPLPAAARRGGADAGNSGDRRYAPTRPASIFGQARPQQGKTIFGEDLISDKSLDEVILSYLADDLEPPAEKK